jgi:hypothetical protein
MLLTTTAGGAETRLAAAPGAVNLVGGILTPDPDAPGLGLTLRESDAERYRRC